IGRIGQIGRIGRIGRIGLYRPPSLPLQRSPYDRPWARPIEAIAKDPQAAPNKALRRSIFSLFQRFKCMMKFLESESLLRAPTDARV
ncbi:MAG: hypothetical protein ACK5GD_12520, partial [Planctomycetota bacterium]